MNIRNLDYGCDSEFLYEILLARWHNDCVNVQHRNSPECPTYEQHETYLADKPWKHHAILQHEGTDIGVMYIESRFDGNYFCWHIHKANLKSEFKTGKLSPTKFKQTWPKVYGDFLKSTGLNCFTATCNPDNTNIIRWLEHGMWEHVESVYRLSPENFNKFIGSDVYNGTKLKK
jgi:hypothetical protein